MDGVLVNSEPFYVQIEKQLFKQVGANVSDAEHITYMGTATDVMWKKVKEKHGLTQTINELVELTDSIVTPYFTNLETIDPMPGVQSLIESLKSENIPIALASSSASNVIEIVLHKTEFKKHFNVVVDSKMAGASKPEPDIFLLAAKKLGIAPESCVVIEDSTNGIRAAKSAGMFCIAYAGSGSEFQNQSQADLIISDFNEI